MGFQPGAESRNPQGPRRPRAARNCWLKPQLQSVPSSLNKPKRLPVPAGADQAMDHISQGAEAEERAPGAGSFSAPPTGSGWAWRGTLRASRAAGSGVSQARLGHVQAWDGISPQHDDIRDQLRDCPRPMGLTSAVVGARTGRGSAQNQYTFAAASSLLIAESALSRHQFDRLRCATQWTLPVSTILRQTPD